MSGMVQKRQVNGRARVRELTPAAAATVDECRSDLKDGLLAFCVGVGLAEVRSMLDEAITGVCGPKGAWNPERVAKRHGTEPSKVTLGGRRVALAKPRARHVDADGNDAGEVVLGEWQQLAERAPLCQLTLERALAGVSCRDYELALEPVGEVDESSTSRSSVARRLKQSMDRALEELMGRSLSDLELAAILIDGVEIAGETCVVAMGVRMDGCKVPLGLRAGSTENTTVVTALLADFQERGLDCSQRLLAVLDGAKALAKAVRKVFGNDVTIQRCQVHKKRNVKDHLPDEQWPWVSMKMTKAYAEADHDKALSMLTSLANRLDESWPDAAGSLREGLADTLTVTRLGITGALKRTLATTNMIESAIDTVRTNQRNVKRWRDGNMRQRWTAAGLLDGERRWRRIRGYRELPLLHMRIQHDRDKHTNKVTDAERQVA